MTRIVYDTATTINGFLADESQSLEWLFASDPGDSHFEEFFAEFIAKIGAIALGSTTYEWVLREQDMLDPEKWRRYFGERPAFVFTSRELPAPPGVDVSFVAGEVAEILPRIREAAGARDIWVQGGGDLARQFWAAGALDEIALSIAPAMLPGGAPLFTGRIGPEGLELIEARQTGQFIRARYRVRSAG